MLRQLLVMWDTQGDKPSHLPALQCRSTIKHCSEECLACSLRCFAMHPRFRHLVPLEIRSLSRDTGHPINLIAKVPAEFDKDNSSIDKIVVSAG